MSILKKCPHHGDLLLDGVVRSGMRKGIQVYKCKRCLKAAHAKHYQKNKSIIQAYQKTYRVEHAEKVREIKRKSYAKRSTYWLESQRRSRLKWKEKNPEKYQLIKNLISTRHVTTLKDSYVKRYMKTTLKDIPRQMIELKRVMIQLRRLIRATTSVTNEMVIEAEEKKK